MCIQGVDAGFILLQEKKAIYDLVYLKQDTQSEIWNLESDLYMLSRDEDGCHAMPSHLVFSSYNSSSKVLSLSERIFILQRLVIYFYYLV